MGIKLVLIDNSNLINMAHFIQSIFVLLLLISFNSNSQVKALSLELKYPIGVGHNFLTGNYDGIIEPGLRLRFLNKEQFALGASIIASIHKLDNTNYPSGFKGTSIFYQPNLFGELNFKKPHFLHLSINLGYTAFVFNTDSGSLGAFGIPNEHETYHGINIGSGLIFDITNQIFTHVAYGFIHLPENQGIPKSGYNQNISILSFGLGMRL
ncbi:MAG: hypothetical protein ACJA08_002308 [Cyclobacteriaceae bacterium]